MHGRFCVSRNEGMFCLKKVRNPGGIVDSKSQETRVRFVSTKEDFSVFSELDRFTT